MHQNVVHVGYKIRAVGDVDFLRGKFMCDIKIFAHWVEPQLINASAEKCKAIQIMQNDDRNEIYERSMKWAVSVPLAYRAMTTSVVSPPVSKLSLRTTSVV